MAGYKTHITVSTCCGVGYGVAGYFLLGIPAEACALAGGLCSVSGMLPDMDSESGTPVREGSCFAAAVVPMLMLDRFQAMGWTTETIALVGGAIYLAIRYTLPYLLAKFSNHRGMWHSWPALGIATLAAWLVCSGANVDIRMFKAGGVTLGFFSHLLLDEIWSIDFSRGIPKFKKSFGTALKFYGKSTYANLSTYGKLAVLTVVAVGDPLMMEQLHFHPPALTQQLAAFTQEAPQQQPGVEQVDWRTAAEQSQWQPAPLQPQAQPQPQWQPPLQPSYGQPYSQPYQPAPQQNYQPNMQPYPPTVYLPPPPTSNLAPRDGLFR